MRVVATAVSTRTAALAASGPAAALAAAALAATLATATKPTAALAAALAAAALAATLRTPKLWRHVGHVVLRRLQRWHGAPLLLQVGHVQKHAGLQDLV